MDDPPEDLVGVVGRDRQAQQVGGLDLVAIRGRRLVPGRLEAQRPPAVGRGRITDDQAARLVGILGAGLGDDRVADRSRQRRDGRARMLAPAVSHPDLRWPARDDPQEQGVVPVLGLHFDDGLLELEAGAPDEGPVLLRAVVAEEHRRTEPVRLDRVRRILGAHRCDEDAARSQPAAHRGEQLRQVGARDMRQRVEGDDRVEARRGEVECRHVGMDERRLRDGGAGELDLSSRDVDAGHAAARRRGHGSSERRRRSRGRGRRRPAGCARAPWPASAAAWRRVGRRSTRSSARRSRRSRRRRSRAGRRLRRPPPSRRDHHQLTPPSSASSISSRFVEYVPADRYFQPPSGSSATIVPDSISAATRAAATRTAPHDGPPKIPSR